MRTSAELDEITALAEVYELAPVWVMPKGTDAAVVTARLHPDRAEHELLDQIRACVPPVLLYQGWVFAMTST